MRTRRKRKERGLCLPCPPILEAITKCGPVPMLPYSPDRPSAKSDIVGPPYPPANNGACRSRSVWGDVVLNRIVTILRPWLI